MTERDTPSPHAADDIAYGHLQRAHDLYRKAQYAVLDGREREATQYEREAREAEDAARLFVRQSASSAPPRGGPMSDSTPPSTPVANAPTTRREAILAVVNAVGTRWPDAEYPSLLPLAHLVVDVLRPDLARRQSDDSAPEREQ